MHGSMFVAVAYDRYYPEGGANDFAGPPRETFDEAVTDLRRSSKRDRMHVIELRVGADPTTIPVILDGTDGADES